MEPNDGLILDETGRPGCWWAGDDGLYRRYHDDEWGRPVTDETRLFEKICLEGFQAGLSWLTILRKRDNFRAAFAGFDVDRVASFDDSDVARLLDDVGIVRHRGKIEAAINNARRAAELRDEGGLAVHVWRFEPLPDERPSVVSADVVRALTQSEASTALSADLKNRGWRFVGPTTMYAFLQSMGVVNDHVEGCAVRAAVEAERKALSRPS